MKQLIVCPNKNHPKGEHYCLFEYGVKSHTCLREDCGLIFDIEYTEKLKDAVIQNLLKMLNQETVSVATEFVTPRIQRVNGGFIAVSQPRKYVKNDLS